MNRPVTLFLFFSALTFSCKSQEKPPEPQKTDSVPTAAENPPESTAKKEPPLTQEELDLIAKDPNDLTPELRRKRAYALRRKIMQNPDSPTAKELERLRGQIERGEVIPPKLSELPGATPSSTPAAGAEAPVPPSGAN